MSRSALRTLFFALVGLLFVPTFLFGEETEGILNKLLAPGPLIEGHKDLEETGCLNCHEGGKGVPDTKCLTCHKEIRPFVEGKKGFHGLHKESCRECHADHKGRTFDTMKVDIKTFDHKETGLDLEGKHAEIKCVECHKGKRTKKVIRQNETQWFGQAASCVSCHKKEDVHFFKGDWAKKDCDSCHGVKKWTTDIRFDHEKDAKYKLEEKHAELKCAECHVPKLKQKIKTSFYKWPDLKNKKCMTCHENYHKTAMSPKYLTGKCNTCHTQKSFKMEKFDHSVTGYELKERHEELKCQECHKQRAPTEVKSRNFIFKGLKSDCLTCHKDFHLFGNHTSKLLPKPNRCQDCHNERDWKQIHNFDHNRNTHYKIDGEHEKLKCTECHLPGLHMKPPKTMRVGIYKWKDLETKTCENCHKSPHTREFSPENLRKRCTECHVTTGWADSVTGKKFDHSKTRFALTERHSELKCSECHTINKKQVFKFKSFEKKFCIDCHENVHTKQFHTKFSTQSCAECHNSKKFSEIKKFDHNLTEFALKGEHQKVKCEECHKQTQDRFPNRKSVAGSIMRQYLLPKVARDGCVSCHADYHRGQLDKKCSECHDEKGWKPAHFDHQSQSRYQLKGEHEKLKCKECHKPIARQFVTYKKENHPVIRYRPLGMKCIDCHADDDVHKGKLGDRCAECHNEKDWKVTRDFHRNFTLSGVHYYLSCNECHTDQRKLAGTSNACNLCHQKDDVHNGSLPNCAECHRQQFWENAEFKHSMSQFPLRGAHRTLDCVDCHASSSTGSPGVYQGMRSTCYDCHRADALAVASPNHAAFTNLTSCTDCHKNQFSFSSAQ